MYLPVLFLFGNSKTIYVGSNILGVKIKKNLTPCTIPDTDFNRSCSLNAAAYCSTRCLGILGPMVTSHTGLEPLMHMDQQSAQHKKSEGENHLIGWMYYKPAFLMDHNHAQPCNYVALVHAHVVVNLSFSSLWIPAGIPYPIFIMWFPYISFGTHSIKLLHNPRHRRRVGDAPSLTCHTVASRCSRDETNGVPRSI